MDCAATSGDEDEAEDVAGQCRPPPQQPKSAAPRPPAGGGGDESFTALEAAQHARNAAARWAHRRDHWDGPPRSGADSHELGSCGGPKGASPAEGDRGRDRSRQRTSRRTAQQRSTSAIGRYQALYREQQRCAAAAASLVQREGGAAPGDGGGGAHRLRRQRVLCSGDSGCSGAAARVAKVRPPMRRQQVPGRDGCFFLMADGADAYFLKRPYRQDGSRRTPPRSRTLVRLRDLC